MTKAKPKKPPISGSRFDKEALGLVLFALGIFVLATLVIPLHGTGVMSTLRQALLGWLSWASYTLSAVPVCYGVLLFAGRSWRGLSRRILGSAIVILSLLCIQHIIFPQTAGLLAQLLMSPLRPVSYAAALLPIATFTLGLEIMLSQPLFGMLKGFFRLLSHGVSKLLTWGQGKLEAQQEGRNVAQQRSGLRREYAAHLRELDTLQKLYPRSPELRAWQESAKATQKSVRQHTPEDVAASHTELEHAVGLRRSFTRSAAAAVTNRLNQEPELLEAEELLGRIRTQQHELGLQLPSTLVSGALERWRLTQVMELQRLTGRVALLERERLAGLEALSEPQAATLSAELTRHEKRMQQWQECEQEYQQWLDTTQHYAGWPDLASAYDAAPLSLGEPLSQALLTMPEETLAQREQWELTLAAATGQQVQAAQEQSAAPVINIDFDLAAGSDLQPAARANLNAPSTLNHQPHLLSDIASTARTEASANVAFSAAPAPHSPGPSPSVAAMGARLAAQVQPRTTANTAVIDDLPTPSGRKLEADTLPWDESQSAESPNTTPQRVRPKQGALELALPDEKLLDPIPREVHNTAALDVSARQRAALINETLAQFGLSARVVDFARGPTVTRYEIEPAPGEKISRIASLSNDLARALAVGGVRVEAPVPGKSVIGLEVPNAEREPVTFHTAIAAPTWKNSRAKLPIVLGKSIDGELMVGDLAKMPHLLIAGSTGSGKSVCVNTLITSLLYRYLPTELRFLMIDPKMVELTPYDGIPHLVRGVVTNPMDAAGVLLGAVAHMERRYKMMSQAGAKNLEQFNAKMRQIQEPELPHLVIIIDELADLMITSPKEVESAIMRLAQMARATGMHLVLATQRPSVDILTSLIKVNVPARIAFAVSSSHDSRTILDAMGAERLTGMGDMLFYQPGLVKPVRLQGPYISEAESARITDELRRQVFDDHFVELYGPDFDGAIESGGSSAGSANMDFSDPYLRQAAEICIEEGQGSVSRLQRRLSVGHARAGKLMDMLEAMGIVSKHQGSKPRDVLINREDLPEYFGK